MNYLKFPGIFNTTYIYVDVYHEADNYYEIDKIISREKPFKIKFIKADLVNPEWKFRLCSLKVKRKREKDIEDIFFKLDKSLSILYGSEYYTFVKEIMTIFKELPNK